MYAAYTIDAGLISDSILSRYALQIKMGVSPRLVKTARKISTYAVAMLPQAYRLL